MDFKFYIFGAPDAFDLFSGNSDDKSYFQTFYDGSRENTKLTIHRRANGMVSYSYLKYNLISETGRTGSFFGMSIVFNKEYCFDVDSLYHFFNEHVYQKIILPNGKLLKQMPNGQTGYAIRTFKDTENEISRIENYVRENFKKAGFENDMRPLDNGFKTGENTNKAEKLKLTEGNETIIALFKDYPMISVSHEYLPNKTDRVVTPISQTELETLNNKVNRMEAEIEHLYRSLGLTKEFDNKTKTVVTELEKPQKGKKEKIEKPHNSRLAKDKITAILISAIFIGFLLWYTLPSKPLNDIFNAIINNQAPKEVVIKGLLPPVIEETHTENDTQSKILTLKETAKIEFENSNRAKIMNYNAAKAILEKAIEYGENLNNEIEAYKQQTIEFYQKEIAKAGQTDNNKKKYANYIKQLEPDNDFAKNILAELNKPVENPNKTPAKVQPASSTDKVTIHIQKDGKDINGTQYFVGDILTISAKSNNMIVKDGNWITFDSEYIQIISADHNKNPIQVKMLITGSNKKLGYMSKDGKELAFIIFNIRPYKL